MLRDSVDPDDGISPSDTVNRHSLLRYYNKLSTLVVTAAEADLRIANLELPFQYAALTFQIHILVNETAFLESLQIS